MIDNSDFLTRGQDDARKALDAMREATLNGNPIVIGRAYMIHIGVIERALAQQQPDVELLEALKRLVDIHDGKLSVSYVREIDSPIEAARQAISRAYLELQSGETEKVDVGLIKGILHDKFCEDIKSHNMTHLETIGWVVNHLANTDRLK